MIVMPSNNSNAHKLESLYPNRIGMLIGPGGWRNPKKLPFAIDNGRFASWSKGKKWNEKQYLLFLDKAVSHRPIWAVVPDAVGDAEKTFEMWMQWKFQISHRGIVCALAVQDGMTPDAVRKRCTPNPPESYLCWRNYNLEEKNRLELVQRVSACAYRKN